MGQPISNVSSLGGFPLVDGAAILLAPLSNKGDWVVAMVRVCDSVMVGSTMGASVAVAVGAAAVTRVGTGGLAPVDGVSSLFLPLPNRGGRVVIVTRVSFGIAVENTIGATVAVAVEVAAVIFVGTGGFPPVDGVFSLLGPLSNRGDGVVVVVGVCDSVVVGDRTDTAIAVAVETVVAVSPVIGRTHRKPISAYSAAGITP
jgi:hypothetical protein